MTDDLDDRLRRELTGDHYRLDLDPDTVLGQVTTGPRRALVMVAAALAVVGVLTTGFLVSRGAGEDRAPAVAASAIPGLPPGVVPDGGFDEAVKRPPALAVLPAGGARSVYLRPDESLVWRVVVVADGAGEVGLPGVPVPITADWPTGDAQMLVTEDGGSTYAQAFFPDGRRLFLALTGGGSELRRQRMQSLLASNVRG